MTPERIIKPVTIGTPCQVKGTILTPYNGIKGIVCNCPAIMAIDGFPVYRECFDFIRKYPETVLP